MNNKYLNNSCGFLTASFGLEIPENPMLNTPVENSVLTTKKAI